MYSDGIDTPREFQRAVKKAMDAGLSRDEAVRALTLSPAEIYGVADRVGSIEKGKIANLVVTRGDIFDDRTKVEMIFVDGRKYTPAAGCGGSGGGRGPATDDPGVNRMKRAIIAALLALAPLCAQTIVIQNATIMTVTKGTLKGSIVVKDGKIAEVGEKVMVPQGAEDHRRAATVRHPRASSTATRTSRPTAGSTKAASRSPRWWTSRT